MKIRIPEYVNQVLAVLESAGWEAYVVGGCVRDALLAREPEDWDVCTLAKPSSVKSAFSAWRTIDTGLKHGTVTVLSEGHPVEITTYRIDGNYSDGRHPDSVSFTDDITADLSRRDFTMNAIAYHEERGLVDPFGGAADITAGVIRCVGDPAQRFSEDALRIMRALRFASVLGFTIEPATLAAVRAMAASVRRVAAERINVEFSKLILGAGADQILMEEHDALEKALGTTLPEKTRLAGLPAELPIRLAALMPLPLREMKYDNRTIRLAESMAASAARIAGGTGNNGSAEQITAAGAEQTGRPASAEQIATAEAAQASRPACTARTSPAEPTQTGRPASAARTSQAEPTQTSRPACTARTSPAEPTQVTLLRAMRDYGPEAAAGGMLLCGLSDEPVRKLVDEGAVYSIAQLAVNGNDLTSLSGKEIGDTLRLLLDAVITGRLPNERKALLEFAHERTF